MTINRDKPQPSLSSSAQDTPQDAPLLHSAFYRFVPLADPRGVAQALREQCATMPNLKGSILLAHEGISGAVAGTPDVVMQFEQALQAHEAFQTIRFKHSHGITPPFGRMKVQVKSELVQTGTPHMQADTATTPPLTPAQWREAIADENTVVIDNRNSFEYRLGHFKRAIDPQVKNFRDFPAFIEAHVSEWKRECKRVAMYCTGGIRCEKTSSWVRSLGLDVVELEGGLLNYFEKMPDVAIDYVGECFVFDNRIALDTQLQESGTTLEEVYEAEPDGAWRMARAKRLRDSV